MRAADLIAALGLPADTTIAKRVPKSELVEHGRFTAADKRQINAVVGELRWEASLKPNTVGIAAYRDDKHEYLEIPVLAAVLREGARSPRLNVLLHRAVPYPVVLVTEQSESATLSLVGKRRSLNEAEAFVIEGEPTEVTLDAGVTSDLLQPFLDALALSRQPRYTLRDLYLDWTETVEALHAARITGTFSLAATREQAAVRRRALSDYARLETELLRLRAQAGKEKQMQRQIDLNNKIGRLKAECAAARDHL
ncbi:DUF4391 domain-containing protein [Microbispora sp. ZYX-F-249]|uniref:DUF4391 domain-containing protein n=1 Tax=Microbispora maris TaxID=3144104 RepID=A0ABV0AQ30_9ACTN